MLIGCSRDRRRVASDADDQQRHDDRYRPSNDGAPTAVDIAHDAERIRSALSTVSKRRVTLSRCSVRDRQQAGGRVSHTLRVFWRAKVRVAADLELVGGIAMEILPRTVPASSCLLYTSDAADE